MVNEVRRQRQLVIRDIALEYHVQVMELRRETARTLIAFDTVNRGYSGPPYIEELIEEERERRAWAVYLANRMELSGSEL